MGTVILTNLERVYSKNIVKKMFLFLKIHYYICNVGLAQKS